MKTTTKTTTTEVTTMTTARRHGLDPRGYNDDWSLTRAMLGGIAESDAYCRRCRYKVASGWPSDIIPAMQQHEDDHHEGVLNMARDNTYDAAIRRAHGF